MLASLLACSAAYAEHGEMELVHVKGCQSVGLRYGHGTKNKMDLGLTYMYVFNPKTQLVVELDHERATFGHSDFVNYALLSPGVEFNLKNPCKWFYWNWGVGASVGYDKWAAPIVDDERGGMVFGANVGTGVEFLPWTSVGFTVKAQQFFLFGNDYTYLKPNFSAGVRYNFHK